MTDRVAIGVDIGGTFTDFLLWDPPRGSVALHKVLTDPADPAGAVLRGLDELLGASDVGLGEVEIFAHATTLASNAIIERKGAPTGLLTTLGHRDVLVLGTEQPYDIYDLLIEFPVPLVPRRLTREIHERTTSDGRILRPVDREEVLDAVGSLLAGGVEALAICFLHAYREPGNEAAAAAAIRAAFPDLALSLSSEVSPEIREYERASTTVANAYIKALVGRYLGDLERRLRERGLRGGFHVMLSSGGMAGIDTARAFPVRMVESGPAAGVLAARYHGLLVGEPNVLSFDMGGTTAKVCLVRDGEAASTSRMEVARIRRFKPGSGLPLRTPAVDLIEVGAGGGSLAHVDGTGRLRVGPDSAGADPGPACYGRGGSRPTVTDACLVLGYFDADSFLGGEMRLDREAAHRAVQEHVADAFGLGVPAAAWGIYSLVVEQMAAAARVHAAERAADPRRCALLAFGGAGPACAYRVATVLRIPRVLVPPGAGVGSAFGLLVAPLSFDLSRSRLERLDAADWPAVLALVDEMTERATGQLREAGVPAERVRVALAADMSLVGQSYEVAVHLSRDAVAAGDVAAIEAAFQQVYEGRYGRRGHGFPIQVLTWRVRAVESTGVHGALAEVQARALARPGDARIGVRDAYFPEAGGYASCAVFDRYRLLPGSVLEGPAILEERESTTVVGPGARLEVDAYRNLVIQAPAPETPRAATMTPTGVSR